jgi:hypothetical protein
LPLLDRRILDFVYYWDPRDDEPAETSDAERNQKRTLRRLSADCCKRIGWRHWRLSDKDRKKLNKRNLSIIIVGESEVLYFKNDRTADKAWEEFVSGGCLE